MYPVQSDLRYSLGEFLKCELARKDMDYRSFARRFRKYDVRETEHSIRCKLARGTFSAVFLLIALDILGHRKIEKREIELAGKKAAETP